MGKNFMYLFFQFREILTCILLSESRRRTELNWKLETFYISGLLLLSSLNYKECLRQSFEQASCVSLVN